MKNNNIFNAIVNKKSLLDSWNCVLKGNSLTGTDRINIIKFSSNLDYNLDKLGFDLVNDLYMPAPVKIINKYKGIAIVSLVDKIVHYSVKKALEQVFKHEFIEHNYGYIEGKSIYQSIDYINHCIYNKNINFFYKLDIHNFFLSINHEKLMSIINLYDIDELTVNLICKILKTKIYNGEELFDNNKGLVLGSPLSPLLSNIYMIDIDRLFNNRFEMYCRYSDDILIGNSYEFDIESIDFIRSNLRKYDLKENSKKTQFVDAKTGFEYLGYEFKNHYDSRNYVVSPTQKDLPLILNYINDSSLAEEEIKYLTESVISLKNIYDKILLYKVIQKNSFKKYRRTVSQYLMSLKLNDDIIKDIDSIDDYDQIFEKLIDYYIKNNMFSLADKLNNEFRHIKDKLGSDNFPHDYEAINAYLDLFESCSTFYIGSINGNSITYVEIKRKLESSDVKRLIAQKQCFAVRPTIDGSFSEIFVIDIDIPKEILIKIEFNQKQIEVLLKKLKAIALNITEKLRMYNLKSYIEFSGYKGYHIWMFMNGAVSIENIWKLINDILKDVSFRHVNFECFPSEDGEMEQLIKIPLSVNLKSDIKSYFIDDNGKRAVDQLKFIKNIEKNDISRLPDRIATHVKKFNKTENKDLNNFEIPEYIKNILDNCHIINCLCNKALENNYLNYYERNAILYVFGQCGEQGKKYVHKIMSHCFNYNENITQGFIERMKEKPVSCQKLIGRFASLSEYCKCNFDDFPLFYPSPVIYGYIKSCDEVNKPDYIDKEQRIVEILKINEELKINSLANTLMELYSKKNEVEKDIAICKKELINIFEKMNITSFPVDKGMLILNDNDFYIKV